MKHEVDVKCIENLSDKIRIMSQNKVSIIHSLILLHLSHLLI